MCRGGLDRGLICTAGFVVLYLGALAVARRFGRPFSGGPVRVGLAASLVLFVFPALAVIEPAFTRPLPLFGTLLALVVLTAWRAAMESAGTLITSRPFSRLPRRRSGRPSYLTESRLRTAVVLYAIFGIVAMAAPVLARRAGRQFLPGWGSGVVLLASLVLLAFVSLGPVSSAALWALALLLAIMNAGLFIESASGGLPRISQIGSLLSWGLLALWWPRAAGSVGVLPSLIVMTGLTLHHPRRVRVGGRRAAGERRARQRRPRQFSQGLYLALDRPFVPPADCGQP